MGNLCKTAKSINSTSLIKDSKKKIKHGVTTQHIDYGNEKSLFLLISENKLFSKINEASSPIEKIKSSLNFLSIILSIPDSNLEIYQNTVTQILEPILEEIHDNPKLVSKFWSYFLAIINQTFMKRKTNGQGLKNQSIGCFLSKTFCCQRLMIWRKNIGKNR